jgi:circadian clock protein KaiB
MSNNAPTRTPTNHRCSARLFVCGDAPNSRKARNNLQRLRETLDHVEFEVEVIDVEKTPQAALDQGIFVNPALQVIEPAPGMLIYGDLSDLTALQGLYPNGGSDG